MDTLQVIAEPQRRRILSMIWDEEMAASEIASRFDVTFGAISQHLAVLRESDLVKVRKDGNRRLYQADQGMLAPYEGILRSMWEDTLGDLAQAIEENKS